MENRQAYHQKLRKCSSMKAIQILSAISYSESFSSITEICEKTGLSIGTVHRILKELIECGFVIRDPGQRKYRAGFEAWSFAMRLKYTDYLHEAAKEEMARLNTLSEETVHLIILEGDQGVYIDKLLAQSSVSLSSQVGRSVPLFCTGGGKALLAHQAESRIEDYLNRVPLEKYTDHTIFTKEELLKELEVIRVRGYAVDNREHNSDIICVAAPVFDQRNDVICAIGISAPDYRFSLEDAYGLAGEIIKSADIITEKIQR